MKSYRRTLAIVGLGLWSASLSIGALRVILPIYFASLGVSIPKIAFLFFLDTVGQILAPILIGMVINRVGYRRCMLGGLIIHSLISFMYIFDPAFVLIYLERFVRGLITMPLMSEVYVKQFSPPASQPHHINIVLGLRDVSKGAGMFIGGALVALLPFQYSVIIFGLLTSIAAIGAFFYLPDLREEVRTPIFKIWGLVDAKIKNLGLARGFLQGAEDAWSGAILPIYLITVFGLPSAQVGAVMMIGLIFYGANVSLLSRWLISGWDRKKGLVFCSVLLVPIALSMSLPGSVYVFIFVMCLYQFLNGACAVYQNHLKLEFASKEKTSIDLAAFKTLSNVFKPIAIFIAGFLADVMGFNWVFYFSGFLVALSALTSFLLTNPARLTTAVIPSSFDTEVAALRKEL